MAQGDATGAASAGTTASAGTPTRAARGAAIAALYGWGNSPFAYKVQMAAAHLALPLDVRVASLADCMQAQRRTGKRKTPFLVAGGAGGDSDAGDNASAASAGAEWVSDSTAICAWLEARAGERRARGASERRAPSPPTDAPGRAESMLPTDARDRAECLLLEDWADEGLNRAAEPWIWVGGGRFDRIHRMVWTEQVHGPSRWAFRLMKAPMRRIWQKRVDAHGGLDATRALLCAQLDLIERRLDGARWLFGDAPRVADLAIAAMLANLVRLQCSDDLDARPATAALVRRAAACLPWAGA